jgi:hypothetical protein
MKYYFYDGVGAAKNGVWLTDSIFLIFVRGHIHIAYTPPLAPSRPRIAALQPRAALSNALQILGDSKISNAFNSKKRFFNDINDLEDIGN